MTDIFDSYPPLHNYRFGGNVEGVDWSGKFYFWPGRNEPWEFAYCINEQQDHADELTCYGKTPGEAFELLVARFIMLNEGKPSKTLVELLPMLRAYFNPNGTARMGMFLEM